MAENCFSAIPWDLDPSSKQYNGEYYDLGDYLACAIPNIFGYIQMIFVAAAIIIVMHLIYKTATNRDNTSVLEELQKQWPYTIILAIVAIGGAGTILNIALKFLGFGEVQIWLDVLNSFLERL